MASCDSYSAKMYSSLMTVIFQESFLETIFRIGNSQFGIISSIPYFSTMMINILLLASFGKTLRRKKNVQKR